MEKIYAFIDAQNIEYGISSQRWKLDWGKFRLFLKNKYSVGKAFLFIGYIPQNVHLYRYLRKTGYILIFKKVLPIRKGAWFGYKGNVDAELVLRAMIEFRNYTKCIICSADGDFHCLVEYLDSKKKLSGIVVPSRKYSSLLRQFKRYLIIIPELRKSLEIKRTKIPGRSKP